MPTFGPIPAFDWVFEAKLNRVVDGDTVFFDTDVGFGIVWTVSVRFKDLNAPEVVGPSKAAGLAAKQFTADWLAAGAANDAEEWPFLIQTIKWEREKYGRWLGVIWRRSDGACLNADLLASGNAVPYLVSLEEYEP